MEGILQSVFSENSAKPALVSRDVRLTFGELFDIVTRCAQSIIEQNFDAVIIGAQSKIEAIVLMLGCVFARRPFVSIDVDKPIEVVLEHLRVLNQSAVIVGVNLSSGALEIDVYPIQTTDDLRIEFLISDLMSVMFTSGSTGKPRGVLVPRSAVVNLLHKPRFFRLSTDDVFATYSQLSFDASTFEIFTPLLNGNTLVVLDKMDVISTETLQRRVNEYNITCLWVTAGLFNEQVRTGRYQGLKLIRKLFVGGDKVDFYSAMQFIMSSPNSVLYNGYGPTENTIFSTVAELNRQSLNAASAVPIGKAVDGVECVMLDDDGNLISGEGSGRLFLTGKGMSFGYFNSTEETARCFGPFVKESERIYYDSGDYVRRGVDGVYYFNGRRDRQVKINGHRIDLMDLELRCLRRGMVENMHAYISDSANGLVFVCQAETGIDLSVHRYEECLRKFLNDYELPKRIVFIETWPLTTTDKVDIRAIVLAAERRFQEECPPEAGGGVKELVQNLLKIQIVDNSVSLFDIGFDSISIVRLQVELESKYGLQIDILELFEIATLDGLERRIHEFTLG